MKTDMVGARGRVSVSELWNTFNCYVFIVYSIKIKNDAYAYRRKIEQVVVL